MDKELLASRTGEIDLPHISVYTGVCLQGMQALQRRCEDSSRFEVREVE